MITYRVIMMSDVARCPKHSLAPAHYRDDGTCRCGEREALRTELVALCAQRDELNARIREVRERFRTT